MILKINLKVINYIDVHYIELFLFNKERVSILNMYNELDHYAAQQKIVNKVNRLKKITLMARNFNYYHKMWNCTTRSNLSVLDLISMATLDMNMRLEQNEG